MVAGQAIALFKQFIILCPLTKLSSVTDKQGAAWFDIAWFPSSDNAVLQRVSSTMTVSAFVFAKAKHAAGRVTAQFGVALGFTAYMMYGPFVPDAGIVVVYGAWPAGRVDVVVLAGSTP
jgi:hypothetical protein